MLTFYDVPATRNLIGIDPGSETIGVSIIEINTISLDIVTVDAFTFQGSKLPMSIVDQLTGGDRHAKLHAHTNNFNYVFNKYQPIAVCSESPFYNPRMPNAFGSLTEVLCSIRQGLYEYDQWQQLHLIDPSSVKKSIGAKGNADKDIMRATLATHDTLKPLLKRDINHYDEHSIDAIAVGYSFYLKYTQAQK